MLEQNMDLKELTRLTADVALLLASCGAETRLIVQTSERVASACGCAAVVIVSPNMVSVKLSLDGEEYSSFFRTRGIGLNLRSLIYCTRLCRQLEDNKINPQQLRHILDNFHVWHYNPVLVILVTGIASFNLCILNGGHMNAAVTAMVAGALTVAVKLFLNGIGVFHLFVFISCGFLGALFSSLIGSLVFELGDGDISIAMVVSLLPLVPGFPFVNGILDLFKGYPVMGIYRLVTTVMLISSVCIGVVLSISLESLLF